MFFGVSTLQTAHVLISVFSIAVGLWVMVGMAGGRRAPMATLLFLLSALITTASGFLLPLNGFTPAVGTGVVSFLALAVAFWGLYRARLRGGWRGAYVVSAVIACWLNVFVLVAQLFLKVPALNVLAPNGSEPPFLISQLATLAVFVIVGFMAWKRFRPVIDS